MSTERFYETLQTFPAFSNCMLQAHYRPLPEDWYVIVTDVKGSTAAIERGAYKDVNAVAAASVVAINNAVKPLKVPFVFGGDGATACIPASRLAQVKPALVAARKLARERFGLEFRIGAVSHARLRELHHEVRIARFQPYPHFAQAMFSGGALSLAEKLIKDEDSPYLIEETAHADAAIFEGFECRWDEIPSPHEENVSLLVDPVSLNQDERHRLMHHLLGEIETIYLDETVYHPVRQENMKLTSRFRFLRIEAGIRTAFGSWTARLNYLIKLQGLRLVGNYLMGNGVVTGETDWGQYKAIFIRNTDYRKYDDTLRMVISGTTAQRHALQELLQTYHGEGQIFYGLYPSKAALVTCVVTNYDKDHLHLLDGSDGGYAMAAKALKQQISGED